MADFVSCALYSQQGSPVNAIGASSDFNHLILACCDGSMRKLDFYGSMNGRQLSVAGGAVVAKKSAIDNSLKVGCGIIFFDDFLCNNFSIHLYFLFVLCVCV